MTEEMSKKMLTKRQEMFISEYLLCFNGAEAARRAGYSEKTARTIASNLLSDIDINEQIQARMEEIHLSADEALKIQADIARGDVGVFFKVIDEWMFNPLPEYEILDEKEVLDDTKDPPKVVINYRVRHVVLDMDKVIDPRYSWMIKKFSNSRKNGISIELYNKQDAVRDTLKVHGKFTERLDLTTGGEKITEIGIKHIDYRTGIADVESGSSADSETPS